ncbi:hypothetical protein J6590_002204 [Homalodisca vitripennis]|nr:hypothetical protein J6590_002204 [Homalodisca vitripennis]
MKHVACEIVHCSTAKCTIAIAPVSTIRAVFQVRFQKALAPSYVASSICPDAGSNSKYDGEVHHCHSVCLSNTGGIPSSLLESTGP